MQFNNGRAATPPHVDTRIRELTPCKCGSPLCAQTAMLMRTLRKQVLDANVHASAAAAALFDLSILVLADSASDKPFNPTVPNLSYVGNIAMELLQRSLNHLSNAAEPESKPPSSNGPRVIYINGEGA